MTWEKFDKYVDRAMDIGASLFVAALALILLAILGAIAFALWRAAFSG